MKIYSADRKLNSIVGFLNRKLFLTLLLSILYCTEEVSSGSKRTEDLIVNTKSGRIRGKRHYLPSFGKTVETYLGIPYAKPPVGLLRFRPPQPIDRWNHVYNATELPNSCYQEPDLTFGTEFYGSTVWNPPTPVSEDCLYLNVFVPRPEQKAPRLRKSAVMVWIYGGGFYSGTTTLGVYDGKILSSVNNLIVVSIGYRLGALGFLSLHHPDAPGNVALFDQTMGLEWVQKNIALFGGDPDNVTLFGESAGSVSVSLHLLSPLSHDKFQRAILQSGSANMPWATLTVTESVRRAKEMAYDYLNCRKTDDMSELAACLRAIPADRIVEKQWVSRGIMQFPFLPTVDGVFLPDTPSALIRRRAFKKCPILVGSNANEGSFFVIYDLKDYLTLDSKTMTEKQFQESLEQIFYYYPQYPQVLNDQAMQAIKFQYTDWLDLDDEDKNIHALDMATADSQFVCALNSFAHSYAAAGMDVYMYYFTQRSSSNPWPAWTGVLHGDEIFFMFSEVLKYRLNYTEDERELSKKMILYWSNFAKTGNPNQSPMTQSLDEWPLHSPDGKEYLELNARFLRNHDKWQAVGRGPRTNECAFWIEYLPKLINSTADRPKEIATTVQPPKITCSLQKNTSTKFLPQYMSLLLACYVALMTSNFITTRLRL